MKKNEIKVEETAEELFSQLKSTKDKRIRDRLQMLYFIKIGKAETVQDLAELLGVHRNTITSWNGLYQKGGIEELLDIYIPGGRKPKIEGEIFEALKAKLEEPQGFANYAEIRKWLEEKTGQEFTAWMVWVAVHRKLKAKPKVARPFHYKKDKIAEEAFKNGGCGETIKKNPKTE
jgi:transposase